MKRKNSGKQILAIMLALVLTISQYPVYSYAQEENTQEELAIPEAEGAFGEESESISEEMPEEAEFLEDIQSESPSEDREAPEENAEEVFGSEENLQNTEAVVEEPAPAVSQNETQSVEAHLEITKSQEIKNEYSITAVWNITGPAETATKLALLMDKATYEALPQEAKADQQGVCHLKAIAEDGTETTLAMTYEADQQDANLLRLTYTQTGTGTIKLTQNFTNETCTQPTTSLLAAQWQNEDGQWVTLEDGKLEWEEEVQEDAEETLDEEEQEEAEQESQESENQELADEPDQSDELEQVSEAIEPSDESTVNSMESVPATYAENVTGSPVDLKDYLTKVGIYQPSEGGPFSVTLEYKINTSILKQNETNSLTYDLPINISANKNFDGDIIDGSKGKVGTYHVDAATGKVTLTFDDKYIKDGSTDTDITGTLQLWATVKEGETGTDDKVEIKFSDKFTETVTVKPGPPKQYDVSVEKQCLNFHSDKETGTITYDYQVDISSTEGTNGEINIKDMLKGLGADKAGYGTISVVKLDSNKNKDSTYKYKNELTTGTDENGNQILSGKLPELKPGESYRLTYSVTRKLAKDESSGYVDNCITVSNDSVMDVDEKIVNEYLWDISIDKKVGETQLDEKDGKITAKYKIKISTNKGTGETISLEDYMTVLTGGGDKTNVTYTYKVTSVEKYENSTMKEDLTDKKLISADSETGKLTGKLDGLESGEYYIIEYEVELSNLPEKKGLSLTLQNNAEAKDEHNRDHDSTFETVTRSDVSVKKEGKKPVINQEEKTISKNYLVTISSEKGTAGEISLEDIPQLKEILENEEIDKNDVEITIKSVVKKHKTDNTVDEISGKLSVADGKIIGTLPQLNAGEYYEIEYNVTLKNLSEDKKLTYTMYNTITVNDGNNVSKGDTTDNVDWIGGKYGDWIHKTGTYDEKSGKIQWTITLNQGAYGDIDGKVLTDTLTFQNEEISLADADIKMWERTYDRSNGTYTESGPYKISLSDPFIFTNGKSIGDSGHTINTKNEFRIEYETTVDKAKLLDVKNTYKNTAILGGSTDTAEVPVENKPEINKSFIDSDPKDGGYILNWQTEIKVPENGIKAGSYYEDIISDTEYDKVNENNWFTKELLNQMEVSCGTGTLVTDGDYYITVKYKTSSWEDSDYIPLSEVSDQSKIIAFKINFNKKIEPDNGTIQIKYSSYAKNTNVAYNTGKYCQEDVSVTDKKTGQGKEENLLEKSSINGGEGVHPISALYDEASKKYILAYKLVVNESNTAKGDITITDKLPEGTKLVTDSWKMSDGTQFNNGDEDHINGAYVRYYVYDSNDNNNTGSPYTTSEAKHTVYKVKGVIEDCPRNHYTAEQLGTVVKFNSDTNTLEIDIPQKAYSGDFKILDYDGKYVGDLKDVSFSMAIYYAVEVSPDDWETYQKSFTNNCILKVDNVDKVTKSVTDIVEADKIKKKGSYDKDTNTLSYEIDINPKGTKLIEGQENYLDIVDTLTYDKKKLCLKDNRVHDAITNIVLKPGSVTLYKVENGSEQLVSSDLIKDLKLESTDLSEYQGQMKMSLKVPDGTYYRLKYSYIISVDMVAQACDLPLEVSNTAEINGLASTGNSSKDDEKFGAQGSSATASTEYTKVILYKRDKNNPTKALAGAEFQLEKYNGTKWEILGSFTTGADGSVQLGERNGDEYRIGYNCAYRITEITPPTGYKPLNSAKYFWVRNLSGDTKIIPQDWESNSEYTGNMLNVISGCLFVDDEELEKDKTSITVKKAWEGYENKEYDSYEVQVQLLKGGNSEGELITLSKDNDWTYTWPELDAEHTYSVQEVTVIVKNADGTTTTINNFDTTYTYTVAGSEENEKSDGLTATGTITVTNTKKSQGIILPGTGGKDGWIFYGLGAGFWLLSLSWLGLTFKKRRNAINPAKEGRKGIP